MTHMAYYPTILVRSVGSDLRELLASVIEETTHIADAVQIIKEELLLDDGSSTTDDDDSVYGDSLDHISDGNDGAQGLLLSGSTSTEETEDSGDREAAPLSQHHSHITVTIVQPSSSCKSDSLIWSPVDQEIRRRLSDPQTYLEPLPHLDEVVYTVPLHMANQDDCNDLELVVLHDDNDDNDDTRHERKQQDLRNYVQEFDIYKHTEEIADLLQNNGTLEHLFHQLVPLEVTYSDFWKRYFFRCCRKRIEQELIQQHNDERTTFTTLKGEADSEALVDIAMNASYNTSVMKMRYNWSQEGARVDRGTMYASYV